MLIGREELCGLIPHGTGMCLLDAVTYWDSDKIICRSDSHRDPSNPLLADFGLPAVCALEYGAQAMAVHGGLLARAEGRTAPPGWLASVKDATFSVARLDTLPGTLLVEAQRKMSGAAGFVYDISVTAGGPSIAAARVVVAATS